MAEISVYKNYLPFYALACIASSLQFWGRRKFFHFSLCPQNHRLPAMQAIYAQDFLTQEAKLWLSRPISSNTDYTLSIVQDFKSELLGLALGIQR